jgi:hypothetical protein
VKFPTWLLKECLEELLPSLTKIINDSLEKAYVPKFFKSSLIKKSGRSSITNIVTSFRSRELRMSFWTFSNAVSVEWNFLYADWCSSWRLFKDKWLCDRYQTVTIDGKLSKPVQMKYSVPQGSVLGPKFFTMYTKPVGIICKKHGLNHHFYADDGQLYLSFKPTNSVSQKDTLRCVENCLVEIVSLVMMRAAVFCRFWSIFNETFGTPYKSALQ